jgi:putative ABC transport system ATP-binding protein
MMPLIDCRNLVKIYGSEDEPVRVLRGLSFRIEAGEFVAIVGPSGSGKSTLMHILGALDTPTGGQYLLDGQDVSQLDEDELALVRRQKIGFVFQSFNLLPRATVLRNVELPMVYARLDPARRYERARAALLAAGMDENRFLHASNEISGGQMQRVAVARALVNNPAIILADEPTGNLDQKTGRIVLDTFERIHAEGRTVLLITHDMAVAARASRIIQIRDGQIVSDSQAEKAAKR